MNRYRDKITQNFNVKARLGNQAIDGLNLLPVAPPSDESVRDLASAKWIEIASLMTAPDTGGADKRPAWAAPARGHRPTIRSRVRSSHSCI
jgi:hypothetical protein